MIREVKTSIRYPGGKNGAGHWQWLISRMPTHAYYVEAFAGSAALFRRKPPALVSTLIDIDENVIRWHRRRDWPGTHVLQGDAFAWLRGQATLYDHDWLIYLDPPYLPETRSKRKCYEHELTAEQHVELLEIIAALAARVMLSGYPSQLYDRRLAEWWRETRPVQTRGGIRTECLWTNYNPRRVPLNRVPRPGKDWRERQRIARKIARQQRIFAALPDYEQDALLAALLEVNRRRPRRE